LIGIPYDYWSQYIGIDNVLLEIGSTSVAVGFLVSFFFLFSKLYMERRHSPTKVLVGSLAGASLITLTTTFSLIAVIGISVIAGVSLTGFSIMSFVLSVGFAIEYAVHIVARWLRAGTSLTTALERVEYTMSFLMLPTFMSFGSSVIGVACLAFTDFKFNEVYFFRPLLVCMCVTYFYGCWWLPCLLTLLDFDFVKLGKPSKDAADGNGILGESSFTPQENGKFVEEDSTPADPSSEITELRDLTETVGVDLNATVQEEA
jgi:hypothetical protein